MRASYVRLVLPLLLFVCLVSLEGVPDVLPKAKVKVKYVIFATWGKGEKQFGLGVNPKEAREWGFGPLPAPNDFDIDPEEKTLWIADTVNHRLCCYTTDGKLLFTCGIGKFRRKGPDQVVVGEKYVFALDIRTKQKRYLFRDPLLPPLMSPEVEVPYLLVFDKSGKFIRGFEVKELAREPCEGGFPLEKVAGDRVWLEGFLFDAEGNHLGPCEEIPPEVDPSLLGFTYRFIPLDEKGQPSADPSAMLSVEGIDRYGWLVKKYDLQGNEISQFVVSPPLPPKKGFKSDFYLIGIDKHGCLITELHQIPLEGPWKLSTTTISIHDPKTGKIFGSVCLEKAGFPMYPSAPFGWRGTGTLNGNVYIYAPDLKHFKIIKVEFQH